MVWTQIKDNRRADKITSGPQSHILEGVSWEEAKKMQVMYYFLIAGNIYSSNRRYLQLAKPWYFFWIIIIITDEIVWPTVLVTVYNWRQESEENMSRHFQLEDLKIRN